MICCDIADVRPDSISCLCRNTPPRANPLPLSNPPLVKTPNMVDFPESTFPRVVMRISLCWRALVLARTKHVAHRFPSRVRRSCATEQSQSMAFAIFFKVSRDS